MEAVSLFFLPGFKLETIVSLKEAGDPGELGFFYFECEFCKTQPLERN